MVGVPRIRRVITVAMLTGTLIFSIYGSPPAVSAHCPGTAANIHAAGQTFLGGVGNGVAADIQWTQGNVCTGGVSHNVSIATQDATHWAQVGWRYYSGYAEPKMYCEWFGGQYKLKEFALTHATHRYKVMFDTVDDFWDCYLDGVYKYSWSWASAGFDGGTLKYAQGEGHQNHVQIGKVGPATLLFSDMQWRKQSDGQWPALDVVVQPVAFPYWADEPVVGQMRVWTQVPHN